MCVWCSVLYLRNPEAINALFTAYGSVSSSHQTPLTLSLSLSHSSLLSGLPFLYWDPFDFSQISSLHRLLSHRRVGFTATVVRCSFFRFPRTVRSIGFGEFIFLTRFFFHRVLMCGAFLGVLRCAFEFLSLVFVAFFQIYSNLGFICVSRLNRFCITYELWPNFGSFS